MVHCELCFKKMLTIKELLTHYMKSHSKLNIAFQFLKLSFMHTFSKTSVKPKKNRTAKKTTEDAGKTEVVFGNKNVQILHRNNDIIIRDDKSSIDMEFSFDENSDDCKENTKSVLNKSETVGSTDNKCSELRKFLLCDYSTKFGVSASSSSTSSEEGMKRFTFRKRIRKKRDTRDRTRHYKVNICRLKNHKALHEHTGTFYQCHCRNEVKTQANGGALNINLTSDTESASDASRYNNVKVFCIKCGNGYKEESLLLEHLKMHEQQCRVCNEVFNTYEDFKEHTNKHVFKVCICYSCNAEFPPNMSKAHFDFHVHDRVLESILDMEEDYNIKPNRLYENNINNILDYLVDNTGYSTIETNLPCDIRFSDIPSFDYIHYASGEFRVSP